MESRVGLVQFEDEAEGCYWLEFRTSSGKHFRNLKRTELKREEKLTTQFSTTTSTTSLVERLRATSATTISHSKLAPPLLTGLTIWLKMVAKGIQKPRSPKGCQGLSPWKLNLERRIKLRSGCVVSWVDCRGESTSRMSSGLLTDSLTLSSISGIAPVKSTNISVWTLSHGAG